MAGTLADWFLQRKELCVECMFRGCYLKRLRAKCRDKRLALPGFTCPHEIFGPVMIPEIKVPVSVKHRRLVICDKCNYNMSGFCQALRGCSTSPIKCDDNDILLITQFVEQLPYRGCKHPRRKQPRRNPYGWKE